LTIINHFFKKISSSTERKWHVWDAITKYHKYQPFPAEFQQKNEPILIKNFYVSQLLNALYTFNKTEYGGIGEKKVVLRKNYEKITNLSRFRITEYKIKVKGDQYI